jgi:hypothetical protein
VITASRTFMFPSPPVILVACARIGEEIEKTPKAKTGPKLNTQVGKQLGRKDTDIPGTSRSRYKTLANNKDKPINATR